MAGGQFSVINNLASVDAQRNLYFSNIGLNKTLGRMSSGYRIVEAGDDAAGLAIANGLRADVTALQQANRNANDGIALIQIADGALSKISDLLTRAVTLAEQAASDTVGIDEKITINTEYQQLLAEINRVVSVVNFKGERLFNNGQARLGHDGNTYTEITPELLATVSLSNPIYSAVRKSIYIGDTQMSSFITVSIGGSKGAGVYALGLDSSTLTTQGNAISTLTNLQTAIASVSKWRGSLGAQQNRLTNSVAIIQVQAQNLTAAESSIRDANMAEEVVNMTKYQILLQSGIASLAQANASAQLVLSLLG